MGSCDVAVTCKEFRVRSHLVEIEVVEESRAAIAASHADDRLDLVIEPRVLKFLRRLSIGPAVTVGG